MRGIKRYCFLIFLFFLGGTLRMLHLAVTKFFQSPNNSAEKLTFSNYQEESEEDEYHSYISLDDLKEEEQEEIDLNEKLLTPMINPKSCSMSECFNFSRCWNSFKIHIYPETYSESAVDGFKVSEGYGKILSALKNGNFLTSNPDEACLFVLSFDTLDRDVLSGDYVKNLNKKFMGLPENLWNGGLNHLIFNLYPGTWPNYEPTDLGFDFGKAIIAKASFSVDHFRPSFDVSLPLFHKTLPQNGRNSVSFDAGVPLGASYLLVFKGKRYVHGIGSETRNSLYHLHNGKDVIMLTTCKHGKNWKQVKDERCDVDNEIYDKWNYEDLIKNSSFCLIPRGRRLGSFRFLEAMEMGCIPVILSNEWELPFSETIDWKSAVIWADERLLFQLPSILRSVPLEIVMKMRQQAKYLSRLYFSTVEQIVFTTLEIIKHRLRPSAAPDSRFWNRATGGVYSYLKGYSDSEHDYPAPFYRIGAGPRVTAVVNVSESSLGDFSSLWKLINRILKSKYVNIIFVVFPFGKPLPANPRGFSDQKRVKFVSSASPSSFFNGLESLNVEIQTEVAFIIDSRSNLNTDEVDFAFEVWRWFPHRLVGYFAYNHFWNAETKKYRLTSSLSNCFSLISDSALLVHRYYLQFYESRVKKRENDGCFDVNLNFLVSRLTGEPPIKLTSKRTPANADGGYGALKETCLNLEDHSLPKSCLRFDPALYLDPVSNLRKKYRQMELSRS